MAKEAYYFSHDANARHDPKILAMRSEYGIQGYGIYWVIIEMLRDEEEYKLPKKNYIWNAIAMQVQCKDFAKEDAKRFVEDCINEFDLFKSDDDFIWSDSLIKRMNKKNAISDKRRAAAKARWEKPDNDGGYQKEGKQNNASAMQMDANAMQNDAKESKGKESKGNKKKEKFADTVFLTQDEYSRLVEDFGKEKIDSYIEKLDEWQTNNPKKKKKDHNKTIRVWLKGDKGQPKRPKKIEGIF